MSAQLPVPSQDAQASSEELQKIIRATIKKNDNWISFYRFIELALYSPHFGYYTGGAHKIGANGDFITAPTLSPLFGKSLSTQIQVLLSQTEGNIYEFGAGTGALAVDLLQNISDGLNHYYIIELSSELAERQKQLITEKLPHLTHKVHHLTALPEQFNGIIIGNEVLDAMPCEIIRRDHNQFWQMGVSLNNNALNNNAFVEQPKPLTDPNLLHIAQAHFPNTEPYTSELHLAQIAFVTTLADRLVCGAMIWIDYGFDAAQYYHPQRHAGTLIGHYRHHTIHDPFFHIGLTDLTAHVNFTAIAQAGYDAGLDLIGYTTQANFLINLGILEHIAQEQPGTTTYIKHCSELHQLIDEHEMGELFKVIAFGKNIDVDWQGFLSGDICHKL